MAWWVVLAAAALALLSGYAWWTARRLNRLHVRLDAAAAGVDDQLVRRAEAARRAAAAMPAGPSAPLAAELGRTAVTALEHRGRLDHDREVAENELSERIDALVSRLPGAPETAPGEVAALLDQATRAAFARRFYNDAVRDVLVVRDRRVVRWLHLAGRAPRPSYLELDDSLIPALPPLPAPVRRGG